MSPVIGFVFAPLVMFIIAILVPIWDARRGDGAFTHSERRFFTVTSIIGIGVTVWQFFAQTSTSFVLTMLMYAVVLAGLIRHFMKRKPPSGDRISIESLRRWLR